MVPRTERRGRPGRQVTEGRFEPIRSRRDRATARRGSRDGVRSSQIQFFAEHRYFTLMKVRVNRGAEFAPTRPANAPTSRPWRSAGAAHGVGHGRRSTGAEAASPGPRRGRRALRPVTAGSRRSAGFQIRQALQTPRAPLRGRPRRLAIGPAASGAGVAGGSGNLADLASHGSPLDLRPRIVQRHELIDIQTFISRTYAVNTRGSPRFRRATPTAICRAGTTDPARD